MLYNGIAIVTGLLLLAAGTLAYLHARRVEARFAELEGRVLPADRPQPPRGLLGRLLASADHPDHTRAVWLRGMSIALAGALFGQLLTIGGCNTTPTQTRLSNLESKVAEQGASIVPRPELADRQHVIEQLQAQRDKRIDEIERNYDRLADEMMRRSRP